ncbi:cellulase N-terminal Ig-like domain-containing protein [Klebsiella pneumoniae]|uniref:cellulase N-terminal Ig-like domain-containing protein n=1 Tax=Klebsiella pneumoniae TaxID=573 RepID=UPI0022349025|nr:cellulase N-terminal Ig-like domain-containing protein [Klebsiella pneumoniae]
MVSDSTQPLNWTLLNSVGTKVAEGQTRPFGINRASNENVHIIDFSQYTEETDKLTLVVGDKKSHPFNISSKLYQQLKYDALSFFYQQRSGIPIEKQYVQRPILPARQGIRQNE